MIPSQRTGLPRSVIDGIVKPTDAQGAGMAGTDRPASPVGGRGRCAAIRRDVADRQRLATVLNSGDGFEDDHAAPASADVGPSVKRDSAGRAGNASYYWERDTFTIFIGADSGRDGRQSAACEGCGLGTGVSGRFLHRVWLLSRSGFACRAVSAANLVWASHGA
jgi:hypothetical protein